MELVEEAQCCTCLWLERHRWPPRCTEELTPMGYGGTAPTEIYVYKVDTVGMENDKVFMSGNPPLTDLSGGVIQLNAKAQVTQMEALKERAIPFLNKNIN